MSYARAVQLLQIRDRIKDYNQIDVRKMYLELINEAGQDRRACFAASYLAEDYFEAFLKTGDNKSGLKGLEIFENFIEDYKGDQQDMVFLHLYVERIYRIVSENYEKSFEHLEKAHCLGVKSIIVNRNTLFMLGRVSDVKLNNRDSAIKYYKLFLQEHPNAPKTPLVKQYLGNLNIQKIDGNQND